MRLAPIEIKAAAVRTLVTRDLPLAECEIKFAPTAAGKPVTFSGYASKWGGVDAYGDTMMKGAFERAIGTRKPLMFFSHDRRRIIGKYTEAKEDSVGLKVSGELTPGHSDAADVAALMKHGAFNGLSVGGYTVASDPIPNGGRAIKEFDLFEVSPVAMPADEGARIDLGTVKEILQEATSLSDLERILRDAGFSKGDATAFVSRCRKLRLSDSGEDEASELLEVVRGFQLPSLSLE